GDDEKGGTQAVRPRPGSDGVRHGACARQRAVGAITAGGGLRGRPCAAGRAGPGAGQYWYGPGYSGGPGYLTPLISLRIPGDTSATTAPTAIATTPRIVKYGASLCSS